MKISELRDMLNQALEEHGDVNIFITWEPGVLEDGFNKNFLEEITDVRVMQDWPLPGNSLIKNLGAAEEKESMLILYYGDNFTEKLQ